MAITDRSRRGRKLRVSAVRRLAPAAYVLAVCSGYAAAAEWSIAPRIGVRETYSSNIGLTSDEFARSDWVTEVAPGISLRGDGRRFKVNADYTFHYFEYHRDTHASQSQHEASASAWGEFIRNLLYVEALANVSQRNISAFGPQSIDNASLTGNRTEVQTYSVSPYLRREFANFADAELRYTAQKMKTSDAGLFDADARRIFFGLDSGTNLRTWGWGFDFNRQRIEDRYAPPVELRRYQGRLRYEFNQRLSVNMAAGHEKNNYITIGDEPSGAIWSAGFAWSPSEDTSVAANGGHRYFGKTLGASAKHRTGRGVWSFGYDEDVTTESAYSQTTMLDTAGFLDRLWNQAIPDVDARKRTVDAFIRNAALPPVLTGNIYGLSNRVFLQKSLHAAVALDGVRNTVLLRVYGKRREPLSATPATLPVPPTSQAGIDDDSLQLGAAANWTWHITPRSDLSAGAHYARVRSMLTERTDHLRSFQIGLGRQFGRRTSGSVELRRQERSSSQPGSAYTENALVLYALMQF